MESTEAWGIWHSWDEAGIFQDDSIHTQNSISTIEATETTCKIEMNINP